MRYWSEGLGNRELVMGLDRSKLERKEDNILLTGIVDAPAPWEYEVKIYFDDFKAILNTATTKEACDFLATSVGFGSLVAMAWSIVKFVVLTAAFRLIYLSGAGARLFESIDRPIPWSASPPQPVSPQTERLKESAS